MELARSIEKAPFDLNGPPGAHECWVVELDHELQIVASNDACLALIYKKPEDVLGQKIDQVVKLAHLNSLLMKGFCFRSQPIQWEGQAFLCDFTPAEKTAAGGTFTMTVADSGSCDHPELQDIIRSIDPVSDISHEGIIMVNREGFVTLVNQPFADILGIAARDMIGQHIHKSYPNSSLSRLPVVMETGMAEIGEPHLLGGRDVVVSRYPLLRNGKTIGAFGKILFKDVREVSLLADKLRTISGKIRPTPLPRSGQQDFRYDTNNIIGHSKVMKDLKEKLLRIAERGSNVLLMGETGTGKELFAHAIHAASRRRYGSFVRVNCAAIPEHLLESELFGYSEGAFTDARKGGQIGKFEQAHNGTIFLDEISDMSLPMQAKLLRALQEKEINPLGSNTTKRIDMRVVAATNANLPKLVSEGAFRADLYYRLNIVALAIPPLRERAEDIFFITRHLLDTFNSEFGMNVQGLEAAAWEAIRVYDFPGNIRELRNAIESAFNHVAGEMIRVTDLPSHIVHSLNLPAGHPAKRGGIESQAALLGQRSLQEIMEEIEKQLIEQALEQVAGNKLNAANLLGISRPGLYKKLQKYQLQ